MRPSDVVQGGGQFGPRTLAAVRSYQRSTGLPSTGFYGDLTSAALGESLDAAPARSPPGPLSLGAASADVGVLQRLLTRLGYMDQVSGYFGPITREAVRRFQADRGIEPTGSYGALTRMAAAIAAR